MKLPVYWRYRVHSYWMSFGHNVLWLAIPYRVIRTKLWHWAHYQNGSGSHLNLSPRTWSEVFRSEVGLHRFGEY